ncbi:MAG: hypothetical protein WDZ41_01935 [Candidatus Babeliales bacterium]
MKVIIGIATMSSRKNYLEKTLKSLRGQVEDMEIHVYNNDENGINYTDNAKFLPLKSLKKDVYFFSCDDDIIYPPTYIKDTIKAIEKHKCIVTYHGRILIGINRLYYSGHTVFSCLGKTNSDVEIDVAGTGVCAFRTDYFHPKNLHESKYQKMSDLIFSWYAKSEGKKIVCLKHGYGYIKDQVVPLHNTIHGTESKKAIIQGEIANLIFKMK